MILNDIFYGSQVLLNACEVIRRDVVNACQVPSSNILNVILKGPEDNEVSVFVIVLNDILYSFTLLIIFDVDSLLPDKTDGICSTKYSPTPCQLREFSS